MAKIYERSLSTIIAQGMFRDSFDPRTQTRSNEESTSKGERLEIPRVVDCFFFYYTFHLLWLFHIRCFVLSSQRKNQIVDTIGTLLHHILGEFYRRRIPCLRSTVFVTYSLEIREEA